MMKSLSLPADVYSRLLEHLSDTELEQVAFLFTEAPVEGEPLRVIEIYEVPDVSFVRQTGHHVALTDDVRAHVIKRAWELGGSLVEVHSHGGGPPVWFSPTDLLGFEEWVPHVRWRLRGVPYVALVFANRAFDALVWAGDGQEPIPLEALEVDGRRRESPSGITYARLAQQQS